MIVSMDNDTDKNDDFKTSRENEGQEQQQKVKHTRRITRIATTTGITIPTY
jgi:hypothetical protein